MSSNRMPLVGKSRNWRMDCLSLILRLASSEVEEELGEVSRIGGASVEASCWSRFGCAEVKSGIVRKGRKEEDEGAVMEESIYLIYLGQCGKRHGHGGMTE